MKHTKLVRIPASVPLSVIQEAVDDSFRFRAYHEDEWKWMQGKITQDEMEAKGWVGYLGFRPRAKVKDRRVYLIC